MKSFQTKSLAITVALSLTFISSQAQAECIVPASPIIPDGNVASLDELKAAQSAFKGMQDNFFEYRECITTKIEKLDTSSEEFEEAKATLTAKDDAAFATLNEVADNLNSAIRVYKAK